MRTPKTANQIASAFIAKAHSDGKRLTPMQVIKLTYIAQGWHLAAYGTPLFDDQVEAWQYGPVIRSVYDRFKKFGRGEIVPSDEDLVGTTHESDVSAVLDSVWRKYRQHDGIALSALTHSKGTPWHDVSEQYEFYPPRGTIIPTEAIRAHYRDLANRTLKAEGTESGA